MADFAIALEADSFFTLEVHFRCFFDRSGSVEKQKALGTGSKKACGWEVGRI